MRILWITNLMLPDVERQLGLPPQNKEGWLEQLSRLLAEDETLSLHIASRSLSLTEPYRCQIGRIAYHCFPAAWCGDEERLCAYWREVDEAVHPDVVHIHGSEMPHGLAYVKTFPERRTVVSIQGLVSVIARYYYAGIPESEAARHAPIVCRLRRQSMRQEYERLLKAGEREKELLRRVKYAIGRTEWDRIHTWAINPRLVYFTNNETLRPAFYEKVWKAEEAEPHTVFMTQGTAPYKGLHVMLRALSVLRTFYPDVRLRIALAPPLERHLPFATRLRMGNYAAYIRHLVEEAGLREHITVLGRLDEEQMCREMLRSNVYVLASSVENSSNSLGEAQLMGVPAIAAYAGGTPTITEYGRLTPMYRFEEYEMLAYGIKHIFDEGPDKEQLAEARRAASARHDAARNVNELKKIYGSICADQSQRGV